jgi:hypothetical protein
MDSHNTTFFVHFIMYILMLLCDILRVIHAKFKCHGFTQHHVFVLLIKYILMLLCDILRVIQGKFERHGLKQHHVFCATTFLCF